MAPRLPKSASSPLPNQLTFKVGSWVEATAVGRFAILAVVALVAVIAVVAMGRADLMQTVLDVVQSK